MRSYSCILLDALGDRLEVGEHAAEPPLVDVGHAALLGEGADRVLRLLLGTDEQHGAVLGDEVADERVGDFGPGERLLEIDDVDAVALTEDEPLHLGVPTAGLVPEVNACLEQLSHGDDGHDESPLLRLSGTPPQRPEATAGRTECVGFVAGRAWARRASETPYRRSPPRVRIGGTISPLPTRSAAVAMAKRGRPSWAPRTHETGGARRAPVPAVERYQVRARRQPGQQWSGVEVRLPEAEAEEQLATTDAHPATDSDPAADADADRLEPAVGGPVSVVVVDHDVANASDRAGEGDRIHRRRPAPGFRAPGRTRARDCRRSTGTPAPGNGR